MCDCLRLIDDASETQKDQALYVGCSGGGAGPLSQAIWLQIGPPAHHGTLPLGEGPWLPFLPVPSLHLSASLSPTVPGLESHHWSPKEALAFR